MNWVHLSEIPDDVRAALQSANARAESEDQALERATLTALREARLATRVPVLCEAIIAAQPELPKRRVFDAVSLVIGLHVKHVQRLYYATKRRPA